jgi:hypothetical protein
MERLWFKKGESAGRREIALSICTKQRSGISRQIQVADRWRARTEPVVGRSRGVRYGAQRPRTNARSMGPRWPARTNRDVCLRTPCDALERNALQSVRLAGERWTIPSRARRSTQDQYRGRRLGDTATEEGASVSRAWMMGLGGGYEPAIVDASHANSDLKLRSAALREWWRDVATDADVDDGQDVV